MYNCLVRWYTVVDEMSVDEVIAVRRQRRAAAADNLWAPPPPTICGRRRRRLLFVLSYLIYNPFFLLLFLFEVSPLSLYVLSSSVVWFLLSLTGIFLLLPVLTHHLICALSN